ncbi:MAG: 1-acyl-sn-glycerol-3-phosphate acyltransferase [Oscillospiraceae bacterium]|nr:1-acyl-sn-glycerol-3-phosphate acyltransferase [Oscillospiraceae bacterium]
MFYKVIVVVIKVFIFICYRVEITGRENIPDGAAVVCGNHTAQHDPVFKIHAFGFRHRLYPLSKVENRTKKIIGPLLKRLDVVFVDRGKSDLAAIKKSMRILKDGGKLLIYPEGTRVKEGRTAEAKRGAIMLAVRGGVPIVPVFVTSGGKRPFSRVKLVIGAPYKIETEGRPSGDFMDAKASELMETILRLGASPCAK